MNKKPSRHVRIARFSLTLLLSPSALAVLAAKPTPPPPSSPPPPGITTRVSVAGDGTQGNNASYDTVLTPDARYVAFVSDASNLVPGDTNGQPDVFVRDRTTGTVERVSVASDGTQANNWSYGAVISADGRYVAFYSYATNLVNAEPHYYSDVYVHDRATHTTERVSVASDGTTGDSYSFSPSISADGRYVAFESYATNLVAGDTNGMEDVFVRDRLAGATERISVDGTGGQGDKGSRQARITGDGRYVVFLSDATNLVPGDGNAATDVFLRDRVTYATERVSVGNGGVEGNDASYGSGVSADGRWVLFCSDATNLVDGDTNGVTDTFVRDRSTGVTERVSLGPNGVQGNDASYTATISDDGNVVAFTSYASNLVAGDTNYYGDAFVRIRSTSSTERVDLASDGTQANDEVGFSVPSISADGKYIAFDSYASNLVAGDTNAVGDVFVRERTSSP
jgi:Tol biopolymer transport system component